MKGSVAMEMEQYPISDMDQSFGRDLAWGHADGRRVGGGRDGEREKKARRTQSARGHKQLNRENSAKLKGVSIGVELRVLIWLYSHSLMDSETPRCINR
ncbi:hypothetical protein EYF80_037233 [Liparis tanakae]|uniref:Uncharacterized protein n=1 Tax=Liparis tanakae TaxID=230148 RepID=A0A4Z2GGE2_9TELE|nr:hypothetical protein EYF80_037233 [Liparis tanakae]